MPADQWCESVSIFELNDFEMRNMNRIMDREMMITS